jgi:NTE family protein
MTDQLPKTLTRLSHYLIPSSLPVAVFFVLCILPFALPSGLHSQTRPKVGLVLSGGGAAGLAHIGVIKVLEEAGIPIDCVAGTSMGSIVGGMFAMGYTAAEMEKIALEMDWEAMMGDMVPRNDLTYEYKEQLEKYFYDFPISGGRLQLPAGLIAGNNITNKLAEVTLPSYKIKLFSQLPRAFLCVGADVVTGQEVVIRSGNLHDALRASMAIPTVFTPVEVDGKLLIDGGFINNFPADHLKEMGADIIIGVDVQRMLYKKSELHSMITIIKQISTLTREDINARNRLLCDILIRPSTPGASTLTFGLSDSIIRTGERYAREQWADLKKLADKINSFPADTLKPLVPLPRMDSIYVREIAFTGLENVNPNFVRTLMDLPFPAWLKSEDIYRAMQRAYGTNEFNRVTYHLDPVAEGARLTVRTEEKVQNMMHVGVHFDNLFNASLLARADFRNLLRTGDQLGIDLNLGENPNLSSSYFFLFRKRQQYGLMAEFGRLKAYEYRESRKVSSQIYRDFILNMVARTTWHNQYSATAGIQGEIAWITPNIGDWELQSFNSKMVNIFIDLKKDNFNRIPYPSKGEKAEVMIKGVNNLTGDGNRPALIFDLRYRRAIELTPKWSLQPSAIATFAFGDSIPYPYRSYIGGLGYYHKSVIPFAGMDYMERASNHALVLRTDLQYRFRTNQYFILKLNMGKSFDYLNQFNDSSRNLGGMGLTYGYSSPVGPVEVTLMSSTTSKKPILFVNLGYWIR